MPQPRQLSLNQITMAWTFLGPLLKKRAAASQGLLDDMLILAVDTLLSTPEFGEVLAKLLAGSNTVSGESFGAMATAGDNVIDAVRNVSENAEMLNNWLCDAYESLPSASVSDAAIDDPDYDPCSVG